MVQRALMFLPPQVTALSQLFVGTPLTATEARQPVRPQPAITSSKLCADVPYHRHDFDSVLYLSYQRP